MLALVLARMGVGVGIDYRKPSPAQESRALGVQARPLELCSALGLSDRVLAHGIPIDAEKIRVEGRTKARLPIGSCQTNANSSRFRQVRSISGGAERSSLSESGGAANLVDGAAGEGSFCVEKVVHWGVNDGERLAAVHI